MHLHLLLRKGLKQEKNNRYHQVLITYLPLIPVTNLYKFLSKIWKYCWQQIQILAP